MNGTLGHAGVLIALSGALAGALLLITGLLRDKPALVRQGYGYWVLIIGGAVLAVVMMQRALLTHDFTLDYVARNNSRETPLLFTIAGMWSALEGSILLWGLVLSVYIVTMIHHFRRRRDDAMVGWATAVSFVVAAFFFALMAGPANPFKAVAGGVAPADGSGPNPLLQDHPLMAVHPPVLYAGYVGFTIPFAFGIAALITGRLGEGWLVETRRWTLIAWGFLSTGIVLGSWWSYEVLGWGGFWAWDPVENASLLPWLTATAYLHSVMVQERRGMLRVWNLSLLGATFSLTILGTFLTRSGVLDSVHAFSQSPLGPWLITAFGVVVVTNCALIFWRSDRLGSPGSIASPLSREAAFLGNNVAFTAFALIVLLGTVFPLLAEAINGQQLSVGRPYFDSMTRPVGLLLLFLMAVSTALPWRTGSVALLRDRLLWPAVAATAALMTSVVFGARGLWLLLAYALASFVAATSARQLILIGRRQGLRALTGRSAGGMVAHIGVAIIAVAFATSQSFGTRAEFQLRPGDHVRFGHHALALLAIRQVPHANRVSQVADIRIDNGRIYQPELSTYPNSTDAIGTPSVRAGLIEDVYLTLVRTPTQPGEPAVVSVVVQPLVTWLWIAGGVIAFATVLALIPARRRGAALSGADIDQPVATPPEKEAELELVQVMS